MSFCPSKDIHSIYIDNEMPEIYKAEYEAHLKICPKCQAELEKLKKLKELFASDSKVVTPDEHYLDQSFERLQIKMKYLHNSENNKDKVVNKIKYFIPSIAAAAAVLILTISIPFGNNKIKTSENIAELFDFNSNNFQISGQEVNYSGISSNQSILNSSKLKNVSIDGGRSMVISGNINKPEIETENSSYNNTVFFVDNSAKAKVFTDNNDIFRPNFGEEKISIRITVPGVDDFPVMTEIELPLEVVVGQR